MLAALDAGLAGTNAFGESERLASVLAALVSRTDFVQPDFERWLDGIDALGARIRPAKVFTFSLPAA